MRQPISVRAKVKSDKPAYKEKKRTDKGYVWVYDEKHIEKRWKEKKEKLKNLDKNIKKVRDKYQKDLTSEDPKTRAIAAIVGIMDDTAMRIGNEESAKEGTYGATTLKVKHVKGGSGKMTFDFPGKGAIEQNVVLENNKVIKAVRDLMKGKKKDDFIFEIDGKKIWDRTVNRYLKEFDISAKDLRGFHANRLMKEHLKKKDFKEALKEVAEIVGHEEATLKNQYLDPELVEKHNGDGSKEKKDDKKKKKASLSIRHAYEHKEQGDLGGEELESTDAESYYSELDKPVSSSEVKPFVDLNRNVENINSRVTRSGREQVKISRTVASAWKILAPFLPDGATITSGYRSARDQYFTVLNYWRGSKFGGYFAKLYPEVKSVSEMLEILNSYDPSTAPPAPPGPRKPRTHSEAAIAPPGESSHQRGVAMDIGVGAGVSESAILRAVDFVNKALSEYISLHSYGEADHVHVSVNKLVGYPGAVRMEHALRQYFYGTQQPEYQKYVSQSYKPAISKRAEFDEEDLQWIQSVKPNLSKRTAPAQSGNERLGIIEIRPETKKTMRIKSGVRVNDLVLAAWMSLRPFLPGSAMLTSGFRTPDDQKIILRRNWRKLTGNDVPEHLRDDDRVWGQVSKILIRNGYIVGPPWAKSPYAHLKGTAMDVSGADLYTIAAAARMVSSDPRIPVKFRKPIVEPKNNAVHIGIESATYDQGAVSGVLTEKRYSYASISKGTDLEKSVLDDLVASDPPQEILDAFDLQKNAEYEWEDMMGFGLEDEPGDWFEKSHIFRWLDEEDDPEFERDDIGESEAKKLVENDAEEFFYRGMHKEFPDLEPKALDNLIEGNPKFFFVFKYHEREDDEFSDLTEKAAEALALKDPRAFFYYHLHHKYPELGRGAIVHLVDKDPRSFGQLGLGKDYPDYDQAASDAINIYDPTKVDVVEIEASRAISKRAAGTMILGPEMNDPIDADEWGDPTSGVVDLEELARKQEQSKKLEEYLAVKEKYKDLFDYYRDEPRDISIREKRKSLRDYIKELREKRRVEQYQKIPENERERKYQEVKEKYKDLFDMYRKDASEKSANKKALSLRDEDS